MATPLRAFLMMYHTTGTCDVEVHRDLEPLLDAWERRNEDGKTAVIHIGFYRPPSKTFYECAPKFPGRVLLTAAAKFALPKGYEASANPIDNIDDLPIYLATKGWGYENNDFNKLSSSQPNLYFKERWLLTFADIHPTYVKPLLEAGITDESSYMEYEHVLEHDLRQLLGEFRLTYLIGDETDDPCLFSKSAPSWLTEQTVQRLNTTVRIANVFKNNDITYISDLKTLTIDKLLHFPNFGRTSVKRLLDALYLALKRGPLIERSEGIHTLLDDTSLLSAIQRTLSTHPAQQADILKRRMGLNCSPETLAEIGDSYGVTRERIRQIEAKALGRLLAVETWDDLLSSKLHKLLKDRDYPLPLLGIEAVDPWFEGIGEYPEVVRYLLANITNSNISLISIDEVEYFSFMSDDKWDEIQKNAKQLLASGVDEQWNEDFCKSIVSALVPEDASEFSHILWKISSECCVFTEQGGERILQMQGRGADTAVLAVLDESPIPLHYSEIANLVSRRLNKSIDQRRAHQAASDIGILLGRGTYGLPKHLSIVEEKLDVLGKAAENLIFDSDVERQWHCNELLELIPNIPAIMDNYHLDFALKRRGNLRNLGRMVWAEPGALSEASRLEVRKTAITVISAAGRPLTTVELRQRVCAIRGVAQNFQFIASDPLLKVGTSLWGLNDRDFTTKRKYQNRLLNELIDLLQERATGIHITEMNDLLLTAVPFSSDEIFGLYVLDSRLAVTPGQDGYIYLREWCEPRRETATEAAKNIMKENIGKPLHVENLAMLVSKRIGRQVHFSFLYGALKAIEARLLSPSIWQYDGHNPISEEGDDDG